MVHNAKANQAILIILDDVRASQLFNLLYEGKLPNINEIANNGIKCANCITSYPAITFPCYGNIITGSYSGYFPKEGSAVPLYHWINRTDPPEEKSKPPFIRNYGVNIQTLKINSDIGTHVQTIFEQAGEGNFLSATSFLYRGSTFVVAENFFEVAHILKNVETAFKDPNSFFPNKDVPKITIAYIPHTDGIMHEKGFDHPDYRNLIIECDKYIGSLVSTLKKTGYYDDTAIGIITDHGNFKAKKVMDIEPFFNKQGMIPYDPKTGKGDFDLNCGSVGFFNFPGETWFHHPTTKKLQEFTLSGPGKKKINIFETLWNIPGVKYMYYRDDNNTPQKGAIHIKRLDEKSGETLNAKIEYEGFGKQQKSKYIYDNVDVYGYENFEEAAKLVNSGNYTIDEWLNGTNAIDFPMIIDQIPRYFKNPRSCDVIISTLGDYCFNYEHGKTKGSSPYSHDNALRNSMIVPFIIGGSPEIPQKELGYCKTTDMVPSLLDLLGIVPDKSVVGKSIIK